MFDREDDTEKRLSLLQLVEMHEWLMTDSATFRIPKGLKQNVPRARDCSRDAHQEAAAAQKRAQKLIKRAQKLELPQAHLLRTRWGRSVSGSFCWLCFPFYSE
eukprot:763895-Hanusia_phi.AAC.7